MVDLHCEAHRYGLLPAGLNELMTDISREVLRAQPKDINDFIARYLGALLEARKALTIAGNVCEDNIRTSCCKIKEKVVSMKGHVSVYESETSEGHNEENSQEGTRSVDENKIALEEQKGKNSKDESVGEILMTPILVAKEKNGTQSRIDDKHPSQDRPGSSCVETEEYFKYRQHRDFWSHSVFSLPGSYMNLPTWKPYSVYDSISASQPSQRDRSGNTDYIFERLCDEDDDTHRLI